MNKLHYSITYVSIKVFKVVFDNKLYLFLNKDRRLVEDVLSSPKHAILNLKYNTHIANELCKICIKKCIL